MKKLDKQNLRKRWAQLRRHWNDYDPIGVMDAEDGPRDEYDAYIGPLLRLLENDAPLEEIMTYLEGVHDYMGLDFQPQEAMRFATAIKQWFERDWPGTQA